MTQSDLKSYINIKREIEQIKYSINEIRDLARFPKIQIITDMPMHHDSDMDTLGKLMVRIESLEEKYTKLLNELLDKRNDIEDAITDLDILEQKVIRYRYFSGMKWNQISKKIGFAQRQTFRIHSTALEKLSKK